MSNLTRAHDELFRRNPDECFPSLETLRSHCERQRQYSQDLWPMPQDLRTVANGHLRLGVGGEHDLRMNDWSFTQLCRIAGAMRARMRLPPSQAMLGLTPQKRLLSLSPRQGTDEQRDTGVAHAVDERRQGRRRRARAAGL